uniref:Uncharacterized protein n=1 Tax=Klebsiella phage vB_KpnP_KP17 TaxID=3116927 RepID=A0AB38ZD22_9CAUD
MALVSQSIKNLKGGISQQPEILRYPEQGSLQVNGWSSETEGLQKRPPMVFIKSLGPRGYLGKTHTSTSSTVMNMSSITPCSQGMTFGCSTCPAMSIRYEVTAHMLPSITLRITCGWSLWPTTRSS